MGCVHYRIQRLCRVSGTLGKGSYTLGEGFADHSAKILMAKEALPSAVFWALGKEVAENRGTRQSCHVGQPLIATLPTA